MLRQDHIPAPAVRMRRMTRFSIRRLLLATAVIALGMALIAKPPYYPKGAYVLLGCSIAGAGAAIPFSRTWVGAMIGVVLGAIFFVFWIIGIYVMWLYSPYNDWNY